MTSRLSPLALATAVALLSACAGGQAPPPEPAPTPATTEADAEGEADAGAATVARAAGHVDAASPLRPGDAVRLRIWREPDVSGRYDVDERGEAVLPILGRRHLAGRPAGEMARELEEEYGEYFTTAVEVRVLRRIRVTGAVMEPGLYPVDATMTVGDAVALAGGARPREGRLDRVRLVREGRTLDLELGPETALAETPLRSGDQLFVPQRGWFSRNAGLMAGIVGSVLSATAIIVTR